MTTVDLTTFGAVANDGKSDTQAVHAAIEKCRSRRPVVLKLSKGQYDFFAEDTPKPHSHVFALRKLHDATIEGGGATFMFHGYPGAFVFSDCRNVTVRNLTVDYSRPPFSLGRVVAVSGKSFDVEVNREYPIFGNEGVGAFMAYDPEAGRPLAGGIEEYYSCTSTELVEPQVMRVNLNHDASIKTGLWVILRHAVYGPGAFHADGCTDFRIENVNVYTAPGMAFVANRCANVTVKGLRTVPRPGSGYPMSVTADGLHFSGNTGLIRIEDCQFEGMGDDAANIKTGLFTRITEKIDDYAVLSQHNLKIVDAPSPGDVMELVHHPEMLTYGKAVVESVEVLKDGVMKTRFRGGLPSETRVGDLIGNSTRVAKVRIKNVSVCNNRARGFLIQNRDVQVENCSFTGCTMGGLWVLTEVWYFCESIGSRDVVVRDCTFENCGYWPGPGALAAITWTGPDKFSTTAGAHESVVFEGNTIKGTDNSGIFAAGVDGLTIRGNLIEQACRKPHYKGGDAAIYVMGSREVRVEGNTCKLGMQGAGCKRVFEAGPGCNKYAVKLNDNTGF